jgi:DNA-binding MarR family transcriptional regulator
MAINFYNAHLRHIDTTAFTYTDSAGESRSLRSSSWSILRLLALEVRSKDPHGFRFLPSHRQLATESGMSWATVRRSVTELVEAGLIDVKKSTKRLRIFRIVWSNCARIPKQNEPRDDQGDHPSADGMITVITDDDQGDHPPDEGMITVIMDDDHSDHDGCSQRAPLKERQVHHPHPQASSASPTDVTGGGLGIKERQVHHPHPQASSASPTDVTGGGLGSVLSEEKDHERQVLFDIEIVEGWNRIAEADDRLASVSHLTGATRSQVRHQLGRFEQPLKRLEAALLPLADWVKGPLRLERLCASSAAFDKAMRGDYREKAPEAATEPARAILDDLRERHRGADPSGGIPLTPDQLKF